MLLYLSSVVGQWRDLHGHRRQIGDESVACKTSASSLNQIEAAQSQYEPLEALYASRS